MSAKKGARLDTPGYDAGKKINGKKRHILVDTIGLLLHAVVHPADIQDRDGGVLVVSSLFGMFPFIAEILADGGYQGPQVRNAPAQPMAGGIVENIELIKKLCAMSVRKPFFFEKKKQKTFISLGGWCPKARQRKQKFFGSFFQKRTIFF